MKDLALAVKRAVSLKNEFDTMSLYDACKKSVNNTNVDYRAVYLMLRNCQSDALKWAEKIIKKKNWYVKINKVLSFQAQRGANK